MMFFKNVIMQLDRCKIWRKVRDEFRYFNNSRVSYRLEITNGNLYLICYISYFNFELKRWENIYVKMPKKFCDLVVRITKDLNGRVDWGEVKSDDIIINHELLEEVKRKKRDGIYSNKNRKGRIQQRGSNLQA